MRRDRDGEEYGIVEFKYREDMDRAMDKLQGVYSPRHPTFAPFSSQVLASMEMISS